MEKQPISKDVSFGRKVKNALVGTALLLSTTNHPVSAEGSIVAQAGQLCPNDPNQSIGIIIADESTGVIVDDSRKFFDNHGRCVEYIAKVDQDPNFEVVAIIP